MAELDYYRVLQVDPSADPEVVDAAFRRLSKKFHPDVNPAPDAAQKMRELNAAHEVLGDPRKRAAYDRQRQLAGVAREAPPRRPPEPAATWERRPPPPPEPPPDEPRMVVTRRAISVSRAAAGTSPTAEFSVHNGGGGTLRGRVNSSVPWIEMSPVVFVSNRTRIAIAVHTRSLPPGQHEGRINVETNGGNATVAVTLEVVPATIVYEVQPRALKLRAISPVAPVDTAVVTIRHPDGEPIRGQARVDQPWLRVTPAAFDGPLAALTVQLDRDAMPPAEKLKARLTVEIGSQSIVVPIDVRSLARPLPIVEPGALDFGALRKAAVAQRNLHVRNGGPGDLEGQVLVRGDWLSASPAAFSGNEATIAIAADASTLHGFWDSVYLDAHSVEGKVEIQTNGGTVTIPVTATLTRGPRSTFDWLRPFLDRARLG